MLKSVIYCKQPTNAKTLIRTRILQSPLLTTKTEILIHKLQADVDRKGSSDCFDFLKPLVANFSWISSTVLFRGFGMKN